MNGVNTPAYSYALNNPVNLFDPTGLYTADKTCNVPGGSIDDEKRKREIEEKARKIAKRIAVDEPVCGTGGELRECVLRKIDAIRFTCNWGIQTECNKPDGKEKCTWLASAKLGNCGSTQGSLNWCNRRGLSDACVAEVLVHEAAHTCGWEHLKGGGVPGNDGHASAECGSAQ